MGVINRSTLVFLIAFVLSVSSGLNALFSQINYFTVHTFDEDDGLTQNSIICLMQDSKGFIWVGTRNGGLDRFDGYEFEHHRMNPYEDGYISGNEVHCIFEDSKENIWVGTRARGLSRYNPKLKVFTSFFSDPNDSTTINSMSLKKIIEDQDGKIWFGTSDGLSYYDYDAGNFTTINIPTQSGRIRAIADLKLIDNKYLLIASTNQGLFLMNLQTKEIEKSWVNNPKDSNSIPFKTLSSVCLDSEGIVWCASPKEGLARLMSIKDDEFTLFVQKKKSKSISNNSIKQLFEDSKGNIWISTSQGINVIPSAEKGNAELNVQVFRPDDLDDYSLSESAITYLMEDRDGDFWAGTFSGGINHINVKHKNFIHHQFHEGNIMSINKPMVQDILRYENKIYVGTQGGGLNILDLNTGVYEYYLPMNKGNNNSISSMTISSIIKYDKNTLAIGTNNGINLFDVHSKKFKWYLTELSIKDLMLDNNGDLWVAAGFDGLFYLDKSKDINSKNNEFEKLGSSSRCVFQDSKGRIWVGSSSGVYVYQNKELIHEFKSDINDLHSLGANFIRGITEDKNNNIWIGTDEGVSLFKEDSLNFVRFGEWHGLPSNAVSNIFCDENGRMWITTNKGLTSFEYDSSEPDEMKMLKNIASYKKEDGLQSNFFQYNSIYEDENGDVYLGGENGFNVFKPAEMSINEIEPRVAISGFKLFNKKVKIGSKNSPLESDILYQNEVTLNHKQSVFTFEYSALNYNAPEKCEYAYKMVGLDDEWNEVGKKREATYTNLAPGDYTFIVKASNNNGVWSKEGTSVKVTVLPAWWNTWWFRTIVFLIIAFAVIWYIRRKNQITKNRQRILEDKVREATLESELKNEKLEEAQQKLSSIMENVKKELGETSQALLEATNSQASSIEEISASIDQMAKEINDNASGASQMYENAKVVEENSTQSVSIVSNAVVAITDISKSIAFISEFAKTTNLLSLNAAIEAAKAGVHGRSFGVVAGEVKKLAENSQSVAVDIKRLSDNGLELSKEANVKITELQLHIKDIVALISQIRASAQNQSYEAANVNSAIQQISNYVSSTANLAEKLDEAIKSLSI